MRISCLAVALLAAASPGVAADRNYSVTNFERIRLDGPYSVRLTTGVAPFARASGSVTAINSVAIDVQGQTLVVRPSRSSWGGYPGEASGPVEIEIGTHDLTTAWVNGAGSLAIDKVKGLSFDLAIQGSGTADIAEANVDQLKIGISGAGAARVAGRAPRITAVVRGTSSLDASRLIVKDGTIGAEGPTTVKLIATGELTVDARGLASVVVAGNPACSVRAAGSASVSGCR